MNLAVQLFVHSFAMIIAIVIISTLIAGVVTKIKDR